MNRKIVDYKKLNQQLLELLVEKYPEGYDESDIVVFKNAVGETIEAVEVRTEDTVYLVKVSKRLADTMANFEEESNNEDNEEDLPEPDKEDNNQSDDGYEDDY